MNPKLLFNYYIVTLKLYKAFGWLYYAVLLQINLIKTHIIEYTYAGMAERLKGKKA